MSNIQRRQGSPIERLKAVVSEQSVQEQFRNAMGKHANSFTASLIELFISDSGLQACAPKLIIAEALKAATLQLPINKNLGFAWIIAYKEKGTPKPQFQLGYKGLIQLAVRSGQYRYINADAIYEGETVIADRLTGDIKIEGEPTSGKEIGYFAFFETVTGYRKASFWTTEKVREHAKKFSRSYGKDFSPWSKEFGSMAKKTMLKRLLSVYGILSIELQTAIITDRDEDPEEVIRQNENAGEVIDIEPDAPEAAPQIENNPYEPQGGDPF